MKSSLRPGRGRVRAGKARVQPLAGLVVLAVLLGLKWLIPQAAPAAPDVRGPAPVSAVEAPSASEAAATETKSPASAAHTRGLKRVIEHVRVVDQRDGHVYEGPIELSATLDRIAAGEHYPHRNDGSVFQNRPLPGRTEPELPRRSQGYYREYVHPTQGVPGPGPQRIVVGQRGEYYYTPDHYQTFIALHE